MKKKKRVLPVTAILILALSLCMGVAFAEPGDDGAESTAPDTSTSEGSEPEAPQEDDTQPATDDSLPSDLSDLDLSNVPDIGQQGTDGDELNVTKASKVEIYLGEEFRGMEFTLETENGEYPDSVIADGEGKLVLDIGGGDHYTLRSTGNYDRTDSNQEDMVNADGSFDDPFPQEEKQKSHIPIWLILLLGATIIVFAIYFLKWFGIIQTGRKRPKQQKDQKETAAAPVKPTQYKEVDVIDGDDGDYIE